MSDDKRPLETALEAAVYAPIGLVLEARRLWPSFVERGRQQVTMAKVVGKFAVDQGQATASRRLSRVAEEAETLLGELGLRSPGPDAPAPVEPAPDAAPAAPRPAPAAPSAAPAPPADQLPIAGYDSLAASQVIPRLEGLSPAELAAVEAYETANRGRKTILGKIAQLTEG